MIASVALRIYIMLNNATNLTGSAAGRYSRTRPAFERSLALVEDLNSQVLRLLKALCQDHPELNTPLLELAAPEFAAIPEPAFARLSTLPISLCDFEFGDAALWNALLKRQPFSMPTTRQTGQIPPRLARPISRTALLAAWIVSSYDVSHSGVFFGMQPETAALLRSLRFSDVERIANSNAQLLRLRWADHLPFWTRCLAAVRDPSGGNLITARLYGLQLLAGELLAGSRVSMPYQSNPRRTTAGADPTAPRGLRAVSESVPAGGQPCA
jgi:hypothetical protein